MDLKVLSLERNPRLWLEKFAKIISVTSISESKKSRLTGVNYSGEEEAKVCRVVLFSTPAPHGRLDGN